MELKEINQESAAIRRGDKQAFDAIFRRYYEPLCQYASGLTEGDPDEAEDLVQNAFVKLWERRDTLDIRWSVKAYLYKMVYHAGLNRIRHAQSRDKYHQFKSLPLNNDFEHPADTLPELKERLEAALRELPPQCRSVFELSRFEALKYREIADQLEISIKTVESQMGKALRLMRLRLADFLVSLVCVYAIL
ncbi:MAG: RNA polymerase sigma-70 factor [Saprospiraceae bacterium]|nr:RNA polymerase sigma-70 factor [Saprospiraceae bacterium]